MNLSTVLYANRYSTHAVLTPFNMPASLLTRAASAFTMNAEIKKARHELNLRIYFTRVHIGRHLFRGRNLGLAYEL